MKSDKSEKRSTNRSDVFRISVPETNLHHHQVNLIPSVGLGFWRFLLSLER
jgi:hypothetical protein